MTTRSICDPRGRRRDLIGRRHADAGALKVVPNAGTIGIVGRHHQLPLGRPGEARRRSSSSAAAVPVVRPPRYSAGRAEPHHHQRPSHQPGLDPRPEPAWDRIVTSTSCRRTIRRPLSTASSNWRRRGSPTSRPRSNPRHPGAASDELPAARRRSVNIELQVALNPAAIARSSVRSDIRPR